jgi:formiminotetrahydrofolate cyclodeaminase
MVSNLTSEKKGFESVKSKMIEIADRGQVLKDEFLLDVDRDTQAFNKLMDCFGLPKSTPEDKIAREKAIQEATKNATIIPFNVLERIVKVVDLAIETAKFGNQNSISDAGVSILMSQACGEGAYFNVMINLGNVTDSAFVSTIKERATAFRNQLRDKAKEGLAIIHNVLKIE